MPETTPWNGRQNDPRDNYEVVVYKTDKKTNGDLLDGVDHNEYPVVERAEPGLVEPRPFPAAAMPKRTAKLAAPPATTPAPDETVIFPVVRRVRREL